MDLPLSIQSDFVGLLADLEKYDERISELIDDWLGSEEVFKSPVINRKGASVLLIVASISIEY